MDPPGWIVVSVSILVVSSGLVAFPGRAAAALHKPSYAAGDRWVYDFEGSLRTVPGFNESELGTFRFDLVGRVEVTVIGPATAISGGIPTPAVRVDTRASGFLAGTFTIPGAGSADVTGTFTTTAVELWEDRAYLPIASNATARYDVDISYFGTTHLAVSTRLDAATTVSPIPSFELDVGQNATAQLDTRLEVNTTVTIAGQTMSAENVTEVSSTWSREVLAQANVTVDAGSFSAYKVNQTLGSFPGISLGASGGGNETAYFSNEVGNYVKREAYANGTRVGEMRLTSYSYGARPGALSAADFVRFVAVPVALAVLLVYLLRKQGAREEATRSEEPATGRREGGDSRAR